MNYLCIEKENGRFLKYEKKNEHFTFRTTKMEKKLSKIFFCFNALAVSQTLQRDLYILTPALSPSAMPLLEAL